MEISMGLMNIAWRAAGSRKVAVNYVDATCFWWGNEVRATFWLRASLMFTLLVVV